ncbi:MAG: hypothetical protein FJW39_14890 [Acidobacteria bacterium]|nr:hypothetical protein [Acidobacteriota bacterium]
MFFSNLTTIPERVLGAAPLEWLNVEVPRVTARRVDFVARLVNGRLVHLEVQGYNDREIAIRMLEPVPHFLRILGQRPDQAMLYVGDKPMNMEDGYADDYGLVFRFKRFDIREVITKQQMLGSDRYGDYVFAILTEGGNNRETLCEVLDRIMLLPVEQRRDAMGKLIVLAGLRKLDVVLVEEMEKMPLLIDPAENVILKSILDQGHQKGLIEGKAQGVIEGKAQGVIEGKVEGKAEGIREGRVSSLRAILSKRFGSVPVWADRWMGSASTDQIAAWTTRAIDAPTIESVFE